MYTTFILDEIGNRKIIMDWRGNPPFQWNAVKIESLLASHPNACSGLVFAHFWTGDDWHLQHDRVIGPEFGYLPNFKGPDLPAPRTRLVSNAVYTRASGDREAPSYLPVRIDAVAADQERGRPRIRCGLCAWNIGVDPAFAQALPAPEKQPPKPDAPNRFARRMQQLIEEGRTSRKALANVFSHKGRWRELDRWLHRTETKGDRLYQPTRTQLTQLCTAIDMPPEQELVDSLQADLDNFKQQKVWEGWRLLYSYPQWASTLASPAGLMYQHHYCGRTTHELSQVHAVRSMQVPLRDQVIDILVEDWGMRAQRWTSYVVHAGCTIEEESAKKEAVASAVGSSLYWLKTERFLFGCTLPPGPIFGSKTVPDDRSF